VLSPWELITFDFLQERPQEL